jgi:hypothetical protein
MAYSLRALGNRDALTSRIHQRIQKNSVPLKEVLTQQGERTRCALFDGTTMRWRADAKNPRAACIGVCQDCRKCLCRSYFFDSRFTHSKRDHVVRESRNVVNIAMRGL